MSSLSLSDIATHPISAQASPASMVHIKKLGMSDAPELFNLVLDQKNDLNGFSWRTRLNTLADEEAFIAWAHDAEAKNEAFCRAILIDGSLAGCASLYVPHPHAFPDGACPTLQMGYWVARLARGQGAGWKAMKLLTSEVAPLLGSHATVGIRTRSRNMASLACAAHLGLSVQGFATPSMFDSQDDDLFLSGPLLPAPQAHCMVRPRS